MRAMDYKQRIVIQKSYEKKWALQNPLLTNTSGIYILTREENGFKYAYVGQAKHLLSRLANHFLGYQHIDLSLKKHKIYDADKNPTGWKADFVMCSEAQLNEMEQKVIKAYAEKGYQLRNKTTGSQGEGKVALDVDQREPKGYREGIAQGEKKAKKVINVLFTKYLDAVVKQPPSKLKEKQLQKFIDYIKGE